MNIVWYCIIELSLTILFTVVITYLFWGIVFFIEYRWDYFYDIQSFVKKTIQTIRRIKL